MRIFHLISRLKRKYAKGVVFARKKKKLKEKEKKKKQLYPLFRKMDQKERKKYV